MQTTPDTRLSDQERGTLLRIARNSISAAVSHTPLPEIDIEKQSSALQAHGACFVTLTKEGGLRGCIGTMEPHQPLIKDVQEHAVAAAMSDYRFPKVRPEELDRIEIEISRLTPLQKLPYNGEDQLLKSLRIGIDGVLISAGGPGMGTASAARTVAVTSMPEDGRCPRLLEGSAFRSLYIPGRKIL